MKKFHLKIITPKKVIFEKDIDSINAQSKAGEITVLANHAPLFTIMNEGVVKILIDSDETFFSIGGGYLETTGKEVHLLVSRAYGQDEIDEEEVKKAMQRAEDVIKKAPSDKERKEASLQLRRSIVDLKMLQKVKRRKRPLES